MSSPSRRRETDVMKLYGFLYFFCFFFFFNCFLTEPFMRSFPRMMSDYEGTLSLKLSFFFFFFFLFFCFFYLCKFLEFQLLLMKSCLLELWHISQCTKSVLIVWCKWNRVSLHCTKLVCTKSLNFINYCKHFYFRELLLMKSYPVY